MFVHSANFVECHQRSPGDELGERAAALERGVDDVLSQLLER